jgi:hypothetical protein
MTHIPNELHVLIAEYVGITTIDEVKWLIQLNDNGTSLKLALAVKTQQQLNTYLEVIKTQNKVQKLDQAMEIHALPIVMTIGSDIEYIFKLKVFKYYIINEHYQLAITLNNKSTSKHLFCKDRLDAESFLNYWAIDPLEYSDIALQQKRIVFLFNNYFTEIYGIYKHDIINIISNICFFGWNVAAEELIGVASIKLEQPFFCLAIVTLYPGLFNVFETMIINNASLLTPYIKKRINNYIDQMLDTSHLVESEQSSVAQKYINVMNMVNNEL